jgi:hypothetical protein
MNTIRTAILPGLLLAGLCLYAGQNKANPSIQWSIKPTKRHYKRGEAVSLLYALRNVSAAKKLVVASPTIPSEISLELQGPDGKKIVWQGAVYSIRTPGVVEMVLLFPSRGISGPTAVPAGCDPWGQGGFCLERPGKYTAIAVYRTPPEVFGVADCDAVVATGPYRSEPFEFWVD